VQKPRLKELGLTLPQRAGRRFANYLPYRIAGNLLFLGRGRGPRGGGRASFLTGKVGGEVSVDEGYKRARIVGFATPLSAMKMAVGSLDRIDHRCEDAVHGSTPCRTSRTIPKVANGMSDLFVEVFGGERQACPLGGSAWVRLPNPESRSRSRGVISIKA